MVMNILVSIKKNNIEFLPPISKSFCYLYYISEYIREVFNLFKAYHR